MDGEAEENLPILFEPMQILYSKRRLYFIRVKILLFFQWVSTHSLFVLVVDNGLKPIGLFIKSQIPNLMQLR